MKRWILVAVIPALMVAGGWGLGHHYANESKVRSRARLTGGWQVLPMPGPTRVQVSGMDLATIYQVWEDSTVAAYKRADSLLGKADFEITNEATGESIQFGKGATYGNVEFPDGQGLGMGNFYVPQDGSYSIRGFISDEQGAELPDAELTGAFALGPEISTFAVTFQKLIVRFTTAAGLIAGLAFAFAAYVITAPHASVASPSRS